MRESDPRVIRTREHIMQCFFELMKEKPVEEISVKELCKAARCSRNTFYIHFEYKDNLYKQIVDDCVMSVLQGFRPLTSNLREQTENVISQYIENFMDGVSNNAETLKIILANDPNGYFRVRMMEKMISFFAQSSSQSSGLNTDTAEWRLILHFDAGAILEFVSFWLQTPEISLERSKQILRDLMDSAMHMGEKYLEPGSNG